MGEQVYFGQLGKLKKDMIDEYERLHAECWPGIRKLLQDCNLQNYSIFRYEDMVFSYFEYVGNDYEKDMAKMAADEENQRWWSHTNPCFVNYVYDNEVDCVNMKQIFHNE